MAAKKETLPSISVFTPSHDTRYLDEAYASLKAQTNKEWEWIIVLNGAALTQEWKCPQDSRVAVYETSHIRGIGALKAFACEQATGEVLVELDHDDWLAPGALKSIAKAFLSEEVGLVTAHFAEAAGDDLTPRMASFGSAYGWTFKKVQVKGKQHFQVNSFDPTYPQNVSLIWYAPNHPRAFRRTVYDMVGGYNPSQEVLDDQDLMCRMFLVSEFRLIDKCLYLQRVHDNNTQSDPGTNSQIQTETLRLADQYIQPMALAWANRNHFAVLDLGSAFNKPFGYIGVDLLDIPGVDKVGDVFDVLGSLPDNSVGVIRAVDFLEHITDKVRLFNEMHRVLVHGGLLLSLTPSTDGRGAFQDPTHVAYYNENSFWYFTSQQYAGFVPEITAKFQIAKLGTHFPDDWHAANQISYVQANLIALKDGPRQAGLNQW